MAPSHHPAADSAGLDTGQTGERNFTRSTAVAFSRQATIRLLVFVAIATLFTLAWRHFNQIPLLVIGQPSNTGLLQRDKEQPFFNQLEATTGLPLKVTYKTLDSIGLKDTYQLQMLKDGDFDLVSLRFIQNTGVEPALAGVDLLGMSQDYPTAKKIVAAYSGTIDRYLQQRFQVKLLGMWTFGAQQLFCGKPITRLEDLRGKKVRVASEGLGIFVSELGGTPAVIPFDQTRDALAIGLVDCAVTSAASANFAGWTQHTQYAFPISVHFGLNGYAISLRKWNSLTKQQQRILMAAFQTYLDDLWRFSELLEADIISCNAGGPCKLGKPYNLKLAQPSPHDVWLLRDIMRRKVVPSWGEACDRIHPDCLREWRRKVAPLLRLNQVENRPLRMVAR
jgi:TRAP-type C4-dicarboxylate transport system substrate-binding protein